MFLQGPHGPFFNRLGKMLQLAGAQVWRVGFNAGDRAFWRHPKSYIAYRDPIDAWAATFGALVDEKSVTDIVLYGDTRPVHAQAIAEAKRRGLTVHVFEEGYMRPYWVTYERDGSNGNSKLMDMTITAMQTALAQSDMEPPRPLGRYAPAYLLRRALSLVCHVLEPPLPQFPSASQPDCHARVLAISQTPAADAASGD